MLSGIEDGFQIKYHNRTKLINDRYEIIREMKGGMGIVYACADLQNSNFPVAIKSIKFDQTTYPKSLNLFLRECENWISLGRLPNLVHATEVFSVDSTYYLKMDLISPCEGLNDASLYSWIYGQSAYSLQDSLKICIQIANGMKNAVDKKTGLIHGDLKPENILIDQEKNVYITDFGLSRVILENETPGPLLDEHNCNEEPSLNFGGTALYMAPEQWDSNDKNDQSVDFFAFGCIFFELLTKQPLNPGRTLQEIQSYSNLLAGRLKFVADRRIREIIASCTHPDPTRRYRNWRQLLEDLKRYYSSLVGEELVTYGVDDQDDENMETRISLSYLLIGNGYLTLGKIDKAVECFQRIKPWKKDKTGPIFASLSVAKAYSLAGRYEQAINVYEQLDNQNPGLIGSYCVDYANTFLLNGKPEKAIDIYNRVLRVEQDKSARSNCFQGLAKIYTSINNNDSVEYYLNALDLTNQLEEEVAVDEIDEVTKQRAQIYVDLGESYGYLGDFIKAKKYMRDARSIFLKLHARAEIADCYARLGDIEQAIGNYDDAISNFILAMNIFKACGMLTQYQKVKKQHDQLDLLRQQG